MFYHVRLGITPEAAKRYGQKEIITLDATDRQGIMDALIVPFKQKEKINFDGYLNIDTA